MNARLSFRKEAHKPPVFTFRRSDGSVVWSQLRNLPVGHDLAHYVVEKTLGFTRGFYGLLDQGFAPNDVELPRDKRPAELLPAHLPMEAHWAEHIVGLLQAEWVSGPNPAFLSDLRQALTSRQLPFPDRLTDERLGDIRDQYFEVLYAWHTTEPGRQLDLPLVL